MSTPGFGLYLHVPFCGSICSYCHFARTADHDFLQRQNFVAMALREFQLRQESCPVLTAGHRHLKTAYLGGGTPSLLENGLMEQLITGTVGKLSQVDDLEFTAEANPESLTEAKAKAWRQMGINRLSLGVQSLCPEVLKLLGRSCDPATARQALKLGGQTFSRVSADWIIGPGLQVESLERELAEAIDMGVTHFSLYILEVHPQTQLERDLAAGKVKLPADALTEKLYLAAGEFLEKQGVEQYEVANFALPGHESRHNQSYWRGVPWLALGPSAHGFWGRQRYANISATKSWSEALEAGRLPVEQVDLLDVKARRLERAILALRTAKGLPLSWIPSGTFDLARGQDDGWWELQEDNLKLTRLGFLRIDGLEERLANNLG